MNTGRKAASSSSIFLAGAPGAGKSTTAAATAQRLGLGATDLDDVVQTMSGRSPAELIQVHGEADFRQRELQALQALHGPAQVVALGGGTLTRRPAREEIRSRGIVVGLKVEPERLHHRLNAANGGAPDRPLLGDASLEAVTDLLTQRACTYATVDRWVDGSAAVDSVADAVADAVDDVHLHIVTVGGQRSRVLVGRGLEQSLAGAVSHLEPTRPVVIITDAGVPAEVRARWIAPVRELYPTVEIHGEGGESMKSWTRLGAVLETALAGEAGRQSVVVGLGGGATCDLAGMVAALLGRGAPLVLVPSSLLAQVDASVGGKAAVNSQTGRNLIGAFHAAQDVLVDPNLLASLSDAEYQSGLAELVKMAALFDAPLFDELVSWATSAAPSGPPDQRIGPKRLARAIGLKADIVARDPFEKNERRLLNFGHTLAHGLEAASAYEWRHGDAVAVGMAAMIRWSAAEGWMPSKARDRLLNGFEALGLPLWAPAPLLEKAVGFLGADKKAAGNNLTIITLQDVGRPTARRVRLATVQKAMTQHGGKQ